MKRASGAGEKLFGFHKCYINREPHDSLAVILFAATGLLVHTFVSL
jgi:hypothetical protein